MEVFTTLAKHRPDGLPVGELAKLVDTPANTMSTHLAILARAGAVVSTRNGRVVTYTVAPGVIRDLALFLVGECCGGCEHLSKDLVRALDSACGD
jgi:DNA-binding transcriptional ArsR family regulator